MKLGPGLLHRGFSLMVWIIFLMLFAESTKLAVGRDGLSQLPPVPEELRNPWPEEWEREFQARAAAAIQFFNTGGKGRYGTTYFESEKSSYPRAMFDLLAGHRPQALAFLQAEDADARRWHTHTLGIDLYACFTLKGQVRKYFLFGSLLDPAYRQRMYEAAKIWTKEDPAEQPHPLFGRGKGGEGWTPEIRGFCVDKRSTDNLRIMREVAVYLFAEETGNQNTQQRYREKLTDYVVSLYRMGMSEWDSENYLSHTVTAWLNLYDFAKDRKMKALAKAALDWLATAAALKYYRGGMLGPCARDYGGGNVVFGALSSHAFYLWFGDCPIPDPRPAEDTIHLITSSYRPPQTVVQLARRNFARPLEMVNTKPRYAYWSDPKARSRPYFWETLYFGRTYQLGTLAADLAVDSLAEMPLTNYRVMSLGAFNSTLGLDYCIIQTNPPHQHPTIKPDERIAQYRNVLLWMKQARRGDAFFLQLPHQARWSIGDDKFFIALEKTYLLIWCFGLGPWQNYLENVGQIYKEEKFLFAEPREEGFCGLILEVWEFPDVQNFDDFISQTRKASLDLSRLHTGREVFYRAASGQSLRVRYRRETLFPEIERDGVPFSPQNCFDVYRPVDLSPDKAPVLQGWNSGQLTVQAGGKKFTAAITADGEVNWVEEDSPHQAESNSPSDGKLGYKELLSPSEANPSASIARVLAPNQLRLPSSPGQH